MVWKLGELQSFEADDVIERHKQRASERTAEIGALSRIVGRRNVMIRDMPNDHLVVDAVPLQQFEPCQSLRPKCDGQREL